MPTRARPFGAACPTRPRGLRLPQNHLAGRTPLVDDAERITCLLQRYARPNNRPYMPLIHHRPDGFPDRAVALRATHHVRAPPGAFAGEPDVFYVALDYAYHAGVTITMAPPARQ